MKYIDFLKEQLDRVSDDNEQMENTRDASLEYTFEAGKTYYFEIMQNYYNILPYLGEG